MHWFNPYGQRLTRRLALFGSSTLKPLHKPGGYPELNGRLKSRSLLEQFFVNLMPGNHQEVVSEEDPLLAKTHQNPVNTRYECSPIGTPFPLTAHRFCEAPSL